MPYKDFRLVAKPEEYFRRAIADAPTLEQLADVLNDLRSAPVDVWEDGSLSFIRARAASVQGLSFDVYPKDHDPPHFHVRGPNLNAKFALSDCAHLGGRISGRDQRLVEWFFRSGGRQKLLEGWAQMHPAD
jgi:hypothetical protein